MLYQRYFLKTTQNNTNHILGILFILVALLIVVHLTFITLQLTAIQQNSTIFDSINHTNQMNIHDSIAFSCQSLTNYDNYNGFKPQINRYQLNDTLLYYDNTTAKKPIQSNYNDKINDTNHNDNLLLSLPNGIINGNQTYNVNQSKEQLSVTEELETIGLRLPATSESKAIVDSEIRRPPKKRNHKYYDNYLKYNQQHNFHHQHYHHHPRPPAHNHPPDEMYLHNHHHHHSHHHQYRQLNNTAQSTVNGIPQNNNELFPILR